MSKFHKISCVYLKAAVNTSGFQNLVKVYDAILKADTFASVVLSGCIYDMKSDMKLRNKHQF